MFTNIVCPSSLLLACTLFGFVRMSKILALMYCVA